MFYWYKKVVFENYANFNGRARRSEYWYFILFNAIFSIAATFLDNMLGLQIGESNSGILNTIYNLAVFIPSLAVSFRRLHDIGKSGWILVIAYASLILLVGFMLLGSLMYSFDSSALEIVIALLIIGVAIWLLVMFCTEGDDFTNKYGPDPKSTEEEIDQIGIE
jgi:uncharacterized membrane protein YhaH (DUF805 family)